MNNALLAFFVFIVYPSAGFALDLQCLSGGKEGIVVNGKCHDECFFQGRPGLVVNHHCAQRCIIGGQEGTIAAGRCNSLPLANDWPFDRCFRQLQLSSEAFGGRTYNDYKITRNGNIISENSEGNAVVFTSMSFQTISEAGCSSSRKLNSNHPLGIMLQEIIGKAKKRVDLKIIVETCSNVPSFKANLQEAIDAKFAATDSKEEKASK
jgi:hypothetical protein